MFLKRKGEEIKELSKIKGARRIWVRMTRSATGSEYVRMESDAKVESNKSMTTKSEEKPKVSKTLASKDSKEKKSKKKGWKRIRQAALATCRYIGLGVAHMSPVATYSSPDYHIDPRYWDRSFNPSYNKGKVPPQTPHWTSSLMFAGW